MLIHNVTFSIALILAAGFASAQQHTPSPYAGSEGREIASLSEDDLAELRAGLGWGLALPAELNGVPGPTHLLELADEIGLSDTQIEELTGIRDRMRAEAIAAGEAFIASERALDSAFATGVPDAATLARLVSAAGKAWAALRLAHLSAHLKTLPLLSDGQVAAYHRLRGYGAADPCATVPEVHDPVMWRRHNGCG
ncbi:MAG: hypothetical protein KJO15_16455 [Alphaproteobacteria bacterium]|nr:hypothetical protein [Alphaproteobacteria bacterium]